MYIVKDNFISFICFMWYFQRNMFVDSYLHCYQAKSFLSRINSVLNYTSVSILFPWSTHCCYYDDNQIYVESNITIRFCFLTRWSIIVVILGMIMTPACKIIRPYCVLFWTLFFALIVRFSITYTLWTSFYYSIFCF